MGWKELKKNQKNWIRISVVIVLVFSLGYFTRGIWLSPFLEDETTTPPSLLSTFQVYDGATDEDISNKCEFDLKTPKSTAVFDVVDDIYDIDLFEDKENNKDAEDISIDLTSYEYVWVCISADTPTVAYWTEDWKLIMPSSTEGANYEFVAHHRASDVYGNYLDRDSGAVFDGESNINGSLRVWFPDSSSNELHWDTNDNWDTQGDWEDLSSSTKERLKNQNKNRQEEVIFDLDDDTADHDRVGDYNLYTNVGSFRFTFNETIGADGSSTDVNITVDGNYDYYIEIDNDDIYINIIQTWDCFYGDFTLDVDLEMADLECSQIDYGRNQISGNHFTDGFTFTSKQVIYSSA